MRLLLRRFELKTPPQEFTDEVMKEIKAMADDKAYSGSRLKTILKRNVSVEAPSNFTYKVLNSIREQPHNLYPPIISKRVWGLIMVFVVVCLIVAVVNERAGETSTDPYFYISVAEYLRNFTLRFIEPLYYLGVIGVSAVLLLVIDYFLRRKLRAGRLDIK